MSSYSWIFLWLLPTYITLFIADFSPISITPFNITHNISTSEQRYLMKILNQFCI